MKLLRLDNWLEGPLIRVSLTISGRGRWDVIVRESKDRAQTAADLWRARKALREAASAGA